MSKKPNVILITLDALRPDHLGVYGHKKNTSPFLDSLAERGVVFKNSFSTGSATPQSFPGILSSTYPLDFGGYSREALNKRTLISEVFQKAGYKTMGFHSNAYLSEYFGYGKGWDVFRYLNYFKNSGVSRAMRSSTWQAKFAKKLFDWETKGAEKKTIFGRIAKLLEPVISTLRKIYLNIVRPIPPYYTAFEMNEAVKEEIKEKQNKPVFLWVHYMDAHDPYGLFLRKGKNFFPKMKSYFLDYLMTFFGEYPKVNRLFRRFYLEMYDEGIRNIDNALKELFARLSERGILNDETAVFITADHGEEFGEHGGFIHPQKAFGENIKVPLIVVAPEKFAGEPGKTETPRSLIDLAPTMLAYSGISQPANFRGKNIFDGEERDVIIELSTHEADLSGISLKASAIISEGHKLIKMKSCSLLFSLDDPRDEKNLFGKNEKIDSLLGKKLEKFLNSNRNK
ncbi:MAG: sulfatase [Candidatus Liptonbacteria bacterium]|nr:sulfatase [Candidatus Liptonbacteria bacterium]